MKHFFRGFFTSLMIGIPLVAILLVFLYINDTRESTELPSVSVNLDFDEETEESSSESEELFPELQQENAPPAGTSSVTLAFAGDVYFSELYLEKYNKSGISAFIDEEMLSNMQNADLFILNEEFAFSLRGEAMEEKEYTFRTDPEYVKILQELGTDVVSIANNHVLDFGQDAFADNLDTLKQAEIDYIGGGYNYEEALSPAVYTIGGQSFAIFATTRVSPSYEWYATSSKPGISQTYDATKLNAAISEADSQYDHTIIFVHWGIERNESPEEYQRSLAKGYIDSGADLVVGCHPHVLQGFEYYNGVPIVYSLGNYLFGNRTDETVLLNAEFAANGDLNIRLIPCQRTNGVLTRIQEPSELFQHLTELSYDVNISESGILVP